MFRAASCFGSVLLVAVLSRCVAAHPGHAVELIPAESGWHPVLQPEHALVIALPVSLAAFFLFWVSRQRAAKLSPALVARRNVKSPS